MSLSLYDLKLEREVVRKDYELLSTKLSQTEKEMGKLKSNINATYGALQLIDKLIIKVEKEEREKPKKKKNNNEK